MDSSDSQTSDLQNSEPKSGWPIGWRPLLFCVAAIALVMLYAYFRHELTLHALARRETDLRQYQQAHPLLLPVIMGLIYVAATGVSLPVGIILSIGCGWLFGVWEATVLVSFAATAGATVGFWISRYLLRDAISHHFDDLMKSVDELLDRDGPFYLLSLRLIHVIPSWLINLLMGWTSIRTSTFWWATQLGTLPATIFYACIGQQLKSLSELTKGGGISSLLTPGRVAVFVLLAALPLAAKQIMKVSQNVKGSGVTGHGSRDDEAGI